MKTQFPNPDDILNFTLTIEPDEGMYKAGAFHFDFKINQNFPHDPPKVKCTQKIYHPNIDLEGNVCLNILREDWKPVLNLNAVIVGLQVCQALALYKGTIMIDYIDTTNSSYFLNQTHQIHSTKRQLKISRQTEKDSSGTCGQQWEVVWSKDSPMSGFRNDRYDMALWLYDLVLPMVFRRMRRRLWLLRT